MANIYRNVHLVVRPEIGVCWREALAHCAGHDNYLQLLAIEKTRCALRLAGPSG